MLPDGVFVQPDGAAPGTLGFVEMAPPTDLDVTRITDRLARRLTARFSDSDDAPLKDEEEALAHAAARAGEAGGPALAQAVVSQNAPVFLSGDRVLDPSPQSVQTNCLST